MSPTKEDKDEAEKAIGEAVEKHRAMGLSITPKVHLIEDHAIVQYRTYPDGLALLIEEFVEQNHQKGRQVEEQFKRINNLDKQANCKAKELRARANAKIQKQIHEVNERSSRGITYNSKRKAHDDITPSPPKKSNNSDK